MGDLVLSLFPGIGLLDMAFEQEGFCVVRGPDLLWGGDIHTFHPPAGKFDGVIGGPPCQAFTPINNVNRARWGDDSVSPDLTPEFTRVVEESAPLWWVMENSIVADAPKLHPCFKQILDNQWFGERQRRARSFWSNIPLPVAVPALVGVDAGTERTASGKGAVDWQGSRAREKPRTVADMLELQGFPSDMLADSPFTVTAAKQAIGNGVPLPMGRAVAQAVKRAVHG